jgi:hypothetical protein
MGTSAATLFYEEKDGEIIAYLHRHFDGMPESHGEDLKDFLRDKRIVDGIRTDHDPDKIFNGMGCLAAAVVAHFKTGPGNFYLQPVPKEGAIGLDDNYVYHIYPHSTLDVDNKDGSRIVVKITDGDDVIEETVLQ